MFSLLTCLPPLMALMSSLVCGMSPWHSQGTLSDSIIIIIIVIGTADLVAMDMLDMLIIDTVVAVIINH